MDAYEHIRLVSELVPKVLGLIRTSRKPLPLNQLVTYLSAQDPRVNAVVVQRCLWKLRERGLIAKGWGALLPSA